MDWPVVGAWVFTFALLIGGAAYTFATFDHRRRAAGFGQRAARPPGDGARADGAPCRR